MGPIAKRCIPVRQQPLTRKIPVPVAFTSKVNLAPTIRRSDSVSGLDKTTGLSKSVRAEGSELAKDSKVSCELSGRIGSKVCVGGAKTGTLLFCGKTSFSDGVWCGVSLDEASGKNDGSVNGIRYFTCPPAHGVFVRQNKIDFSPSFHSGKGVSVQPCSSVEKSRNVQVAPRFKMPVPSALKRPSGSVISGKIQKHGSAQKITGLKRRFLLDANLNSTTTVFPKGTSTNSNKDLAVGIENEPLQLHAVAASLEQTKKLSANDECTTDLIDSDIGKLKNDGQQALPQNVLDCTFDVDVSGKSSESMPRKSLELFMNLSPSKTSSPLHLEIENPSNSLLCNSFELSMAPNLTSDEKPLQCCNETKTLFISNSEDADSQKIDSTLSLPVLLVNQTVVIEAPAAEDQRLESRACHENVKDVLDLPIIENSKELVDEPKLLYGGAALFHDAPSLVLNNSSIKSKEIASPCPTSVQVLLPESILSSTQVFTKNNDTFCCNSREAVSLNCSEATNHDKCLTSVDNCNQSAMERARCLFQEIPVSSTPSTNIKKGQFFTSLCTPIGKSQNSISLPTPLDDSPVLPSELTRLDALQVSTTFEQSLGILRRSQMPDFSVADSTCSSLEGSPVSPSFCNRMFPIDAEYNPKGRLSSVDTGSMVKKAKKRVLDEIGTGADIELRRSSAKCCNWQMTDSPLGLSACAAVKLPDDSLLDLSACAAVKLPDDSLLDLSACADDSLSNLNLMADSNYNDSLV